MGSYPNWWGTPTPDHKALQMPDVSYVADALRGVQGAQLRIVLLTREASQIVRSVCDKRNFAKSVGGCAAEVQILSLGAGILAAQLDALPPPPSVICEHVRFGKLQAGDADTLERLSVLSGIDDAARVATARARAAVAARRGRAQDGAGQARSYSWRVLGARRRPRAAAPARALRRAALCCVLHRVPSILGFCLIICLLALSAAKPCPRSAGLLEGRVPARGSTARRARAGKGLLRCL